MFKRATVLSLTVLLLGVTLLSWQLGIISEKDFQAYKELASCTNLKNMDPKGEPYSAKQERYKIVKEFYLEDEKGVKRLVRLKSRTSSLLYEQKDKGKEIVEKMSDVVCLMQEEVYAQLADGRKVYKQEGGQFPVDGSYQLMQTVQFIRSSGATYHYQTQTLDAENVIVKRYSLSGDVLPDNFDPYDPYFISTAVHTLFSFNKGISFKANQIDAQFCHSSESWALKAKEAVYLEKNLFLEGNVQFMHALGVVCSQKAEVQSDEHAVISLIHLQDDIAITLKDGSCLKAATAAIDCKASNGSFLGDNTSKVCYQGVAPNAFRLESIHMNLGWKETAEKQLINTLTAEQDVCILYEGRIQAFGDFASYSSTEVLLKTLQRNEPCKVLFDTQNQLFAETIVIQPLEKRTIFYNPEGFLNSQEEKVLFSARSMQWDDVHSTLILKENVEIEEPSLGILKTNGPVAIKLKEVGRKKQISTIDCEGESFLVHIDEKKEEHFLSTTGKLTMDHEKHILSILSQEGEKITYKDHHGHIMANSGCMYYSEDEKKIVPQKLFLEGDVCIVNQFAESKDSLLQYILADLAEYTFENKELTLSQQENRVLFYDKINQLELSAPELKIKRDAITEKDSIRGIGDVRFVFAAQELEKIRNRFKFSEPVDKDSSS